VSSECFGEGGRRISENLECVYGTINFRNTVLDVTKSGRVLNCTLWLLSPRRKSIWSSAPLSVTYDLWSAASGEEQNFCLFYKSTPNSSYCTDVEIELRWVRKTRFNLWAIMRVAKVPSPSSSVSLPCHVPLVNELE